MNNKDIILFTILAVFGLLIWMGICALSGCKEAWDSPLFIPGGISLMVLFSLSAGFIRPKKAWLWGLAIIIFQLFALLITGRTGPLMSIGLIVFLVIFGLCTLSAYIGRALRALFNLLINKFHRTNTH